MSDEKRRTLERAARERPDDLAAGKALLRELVRAGDAPAEEAELARLARLGDEDSRAQLVARAPWPARDGRGGTRRLAGAGPSSLRELARTTLERASVVGASDRHVFVRSNDRLLALDATTLATKWTLAPRTRAWFAALRGRDLVLAEADHLVLVAGDTGARLVEKKLPVLVSDLVVENDRAIVIGDADAVSVDVGTDFGAVLWTRRSGGAIARSVPYSPKRSFRVGQEVEHAKFGRGTVARIVDRSKVVIAFDAGEKTLAQDGSSGGTGEEDAPTKRTYKRALVSGHHVVLACDDPAFRSMLERVPRPEESEAVEVVDLESGRPLFVHASHPKEPRRFELIAVDERGVLIADNESGFGEGVAELTLPSGTARWRREVEMLHATAKALLPRVAAIASANEVEPWLNRQVAVDAIARGGASLRVGDVHGHTLVEAGEPRVGPRALAATESFAWLAVAHRERVEVTPIELVSWTRGAAAHVALPGAPGAGLELIALPSCLLVAIELAAGGTLFLRVGE